MATCSHGLAPVGAKKDVELMLEHASGWYVDSRQAVMAARVHGALRTALLLKPCLCCVSLFLSGS